MKRVSVLILLVVFCSSCRTLSLAAEKVRITAHETDVASCRYIGDVEARPPYPTSQDWQIQLRNAAALLGADVVYTRDRVGKVVGKAYDCGGRYN